MRSKNEKRQYRGRRPIPGKVADNLADGVDQLAESLGVKGRPCAPAAVLSRPDDGKVAVGYVYAGLGVIFVIAVCNCPLL